MDVHFWQDNLPKKNRFQELEILGQFITYALCALIDALNPSVINYLNSYSVANVWNYQQSTTK